MNGRKLLGATTGLALAAISGCGLDVTSADDDGGDDNRASNEPANNGAGSDDGDAADESSAGSSGDCPTGRWQLVDLHATTGDAEADRIEFSGGGSLTLEFAADGTWTMSDDGSRPLRAALIDGDYRAEGEAVIDGTATGIYRPVGSTYSFDLESASGKAELSGSGYQQTTSMGEVARDLVPSGLATLDCVGDRLELDSDSVVMTLTLVGEPSSESSEEPEPDTRGDLTIGSSGTYDCDGRSVLVNLLGGSVTLTGECERVEIASTSTEVTIEATSEVVVGGSGHSVEVDRADQITVGGASNTVRWGSGLISAEPDVDVGGVSNDVRQH